MDPRSLDSLPIFPLDNVVLLPRVALPLHIFEQRYRDMTKDALGRDRRIGMVTVKPQYHTEMRGDPPIFGVGCAGIISQSAAAADGTYSITLLGTHRFRIHEEEEHGPETTYRIARVQRIEDLCPDEDRPRIGTLRSDILGHMKELLHLRMGDRANEVSLSPLEEADDEVLVNTLSLAIDFGTLERQGLLECDTLLSRFSRLADLMVFRIAELRGGGPGEAGALH